MLKGTTDVANGLNFLGTGRKKKRKKKKKSSGKPIKTERKVEGKKKNGWSDPW